MTARLLICLSMLLSITLGTTSIAAQSPHTGFPPLSSAFEHQAEQDLALDDILVQYEAAISRQDYYAASLFADKIRFNHLHAAGLDRFGIQDVLSDYVGTYILAHRFDDAIFILLQLIDETEREMANSAHEDQAILSLRIADWSQTLANVYLRTAQFQNAYNTYTRVQIIRSNIADFNGNHPERRFILDQKLDAARRGNMAFHIYCQLIDEYNELLGPQRLVFSTPYWGDAEGHVCGTPYRTIEPATDTIFPSFHELSVFYGTSRKETNHRNNPENHFGFESGSLTLGQIEMTVPVNRDPGSLKSRDLIKQFKPEEHVYIVLQKIDPNLSRPAFQSRLGNHVKKGSRQKKEAFIYIHGHSVPFADAARRTAQLAVDLDMVNGGIFYAWPTGSNPLAYGKSQKTKYDAARHLKDFLKIVSDTRGIDELHLIAHSMGNDVLSMALEDINLRGFTASRRPFGQIIWASPDVQSDNFYNRIIRIKFNNLADDMTLYASKEDQALKESKRYWRIQRYRHWPKRNREQLRAGLAPPLDQLAAAVKTVDTSNVDRDTFDIAKHADYAKPALDDMRSVIWYSLMPKERCALKTRLINGIEYWATEKNSSSCSADQYRTWLQSARERNMSRAAFKGQLRFYGIGEASLRP